MLGMKVVWGMKFVWGMKVELVMKVEWVKKVVWGMKVSLVMKVEGVVTLVWHGDERVHAEQEVQHHAFVLHVWGADHSPLLYPWFPKHLVAYSVWT